MNPENARKNEGSTVLKELISLYDNHQRLLRNINEQIDELHPAAVINNPIADGVVVVSEDAEILRHRRD